MSLSCAQLDLRSVSLDPESAKALAPAFTAIASLTSLNLLQNKLDVESAGMLLKVKAEKPTLRTLCGLTHEETELNFKLNGLGPGDAMLLAPEISVMPSLTSLDVRYNGISGDGASQLSSAVLGNTKIEVFNEVPIKEMRADSFTELNLEGKDIGVEGGMVVAGLLPVMASLTSVR